MRETKSSGFADGQWGILFLMIALLFGAVVRFAPTILAHQPINDGGMFYTMIEDLKANSFMLPAFTTYNHLNIPFAYPPLSLYAGALVSAAGLPTLEVMRWLPAIASTLAILAFYWMAKQVLGSTAKAAVAAAAYALMPRSFSWYVMGGGLSRSFGILFLLLTCGAAWVLFSKPSGRHLLLTIACAAGAVLSHPETALHTVAACALIWLFRGRSLRGARDAALVALGTVAVTSPWWASVLANHSIGVFASALQTGAHGGVPLIPWLRFDFSQEPFVALLTVIGMVGLVVQVSRREWFLPAWTLLPFIVEPRSAPAVAILPLAMLTAIGLMDLVLPKIDSIREDADPAIRSWVDALACSRAARLVAAGVFLYGLFGAFAYDLSLAQLTVPSASLDAMRWVAQNTAADARFLTVTGVSDPFEDPSAEWFPALTGRTGVDTLQGREWLLGSTFMPFLQQISSLQGCVNRGPACLQTWDYSAATGYYDYVYVQGEVPLTDQLSVAPGYQLVFRNSGVAIFEKR